MNYLLPGCSELPTTDIDQFDIKKLTKLKSLYFNFRHCRKIRKDEFDLITNYLRKSSSLLVIELDCNILHFQ